MSPNGPPPELTALRDELARNRCFSHEIEFDHHLRDADIDRSDLLLFEQIRQHLSEIIRQVEAEVTSYESDSPEELAHYDSPCVQFYVPKDRLHPEEWSFVLRRDDWPDYTLSIDFRGLIFHEITGAS